MKNYDENICGEQTRPRPELVEGVRVWVTFRDGRSYGGKIVDRDDLRAGLRIDWGYGNRMSFRLRENGEIENVRSGESVLVKVLDESPTGRSSLFEPSLARLARETDDRRCALCDCDVKIDQGEFCSDIGACNARQVERGRDPHLARAARGLGMRYHVARTRLWAGDERVLQARQLAKITNFGDALMSTGFRVRDLAQSDAARQTRQAREAVQRGTDIHMEIERRLRDGQKVAAVRGMQGEVMHDEAVVKVPSLRASCCASECGRGDVEPAEHLPSCPVAPVNGLHGGMRSEVAGDWRYDDSVWQNDRMKWTVGPSLLRRIIAQLGVAADALSDSVLIGFYLPPVPEDEPDRRLPVDDDPDLQAVADAASRWPDGWK